MSAHITSGSRLTRNSRKMSLSPIGGDNSPVLSEVDHSPAPKRTSPEHQSSSSGPSSDHQVLATILAQLQLIEQKMTGIENHANTLMSRINTIEDHIAHPPAPTASTPSADSQPPSQQPEAPPLTKGFMTPSAEPKRILPRDPQQEDTSTSSKKFEPKVQKFKGTAHWHTWVVQLKSYLNVHKWLTTAEDPVGPLLPDGKPNPTFDNDINGNIYHLIHNLCTDTPAQNTVDKAPQFSGWHALQELYKRYGTFTRLEKDQWLDHIQTISYVSGSNMADHVDKYDFILTRLSACHHTVSDTDRINWFIKSVKDSKYQYVKEHCEHLHREDKLTYSDLTNHYIFKCYEEYPQWFKLQLGKPVRQLNTAASAFSKTPPRTSSSRTGKPRSSRPSSGDKHRGSQSRPNQRRPPQPNTKRKPYNPDVSCNYCGRQGHTTRDCFKRKKDEEEKPLKQQATNTSKKITQNTQKVSTVSVSQYVTRIELNAGH